MLFWWLLVVLFFGMWFSLNASGLHRPWQFMPHRHCYLDNPVLTYGMLASDVLIFSAYMTISGLLSAFVIPRWKDISPGYRSQLIAFSLFIFLCGVTHLCNVIALFFPLYWGSLWVNACCAVASVATAFTFPKLLVSIKEAVDTVTAKLKAVT